MDADGSGKKVKSFTDLVAWQEAKKLTVEVYRTTQSFPSAEQFGLSGQMRRASVSVAANIAEGFARRTSKDKRAFYRMSLASLTELESHLLISAELGFVRASSCNALRAAVGRCGRLITGLSRSAADRT